LQDFALDRIGLVENLLTSMFFIRFGLSIAGLCFVSDQDLATIVSTQHDVGSMIKLIIIALAIWLVITILKRYRKGLDEADNMASRDSASGEAMVQCAYCGVHLPKSESLQSNGQFFCSQAHIHAPKDDA
jgi:uncharacterized protein